jgi:23S rRNA pseudoU1915 N3-methylase RlmH
MSPSFHPETDGQTKRANRTVEEMLRHYVAYHQREWDQHLSGIEFADNNSVHRATGSTTFRLNIGQDPLTLQEALLSKRSSNVPSAKDCVERMVERSQQAAASIARYNKAIASNADKHRKDVVFQVGDLVMLATKHFKPRSARQRRRKLSLTFAGPYRINKVVSRVAYKLELPANTNNHSVFHVLLLKKYYSDYSAGPEHTMPAPAQTDTQVEYVIQEILDHRIIRDK